LYCRDGRARLCDHEEDPQQHVPVAQLTCRNGASDDRPHGLSGFRLRARQGLLREGALNKPVHVAILAKDRAAVDAFCEAALAAGGRDNGPPGIRAHYHPDYYGAFVLDPDGHNIEAVCHTPQ
jgi:catechol 2,3-dioxygenase-like lactoylglutathione lyase family enzyme